MYSRARNLPEKYLVCIYVKPHTTTTTLASNVSPDAAIGKYAIIIQCSWKINKIKIRRSDARAAASAGVQIIYGNISLIFSWRRRRLKNFYNGTRRKASSKLFEYQCSDENNFEILYARLVVVVEDTDSRSRRKFFRLSFSSSFSLLNRTRVRCSPRWRLETCTPSRSSVQVEFYSLSTLLPSSQVSLLLSLLLLFLLLLLLLMMMMMRAKELKEIQLFFLNRVLQQTQDAVRRRVLSKKKKRRRWRRRKQVNSDEDVEKKLALREMTKIMMPLRDGI